MIYRCRWCEKGYCEDCMDWDTVNLINDSIPEFQMLNYYTNNAWFVECQTCVEHWKQDSGDYDFVQKEKARIERRYTKFLKASQAVVEATSGAEGKDTGTGKGTPLTISEAETPTGETMPMPPWKKQKTLLGSAGDLTPTSDTMSVS